MVDITIAVLLVVLTAIATYLGIHVTLHPPNSDRAKLGYKIVFGACGLVMACLVALQTYRNSAAQNELKAQLETIKRNTEQPPKVQVTNNLPPTQINIPPTQVTVNAEPIQRASVFAAAGFNREATPPFSAGQRFSLNISYQNNGNKPAVSVLAISKTYFKDHPLSLLEENDLYKLMRSTTKFVESETSDTDVMPVGQGRYYTVYSDPLSEEQANALKASKSVMYVVGALRYKDGYSKKPQISDFCWLFWGDKPQLHICHSHNGPQL